MTFPYPSAAAFYRSMSRRAVGRTLLAAVLVGLCAAGVNLLERALGLTFDKPPMPLARELPLLSANIGSSFTADGPDGNMDADMVDVLGTTKYLLRVYRNVQKHRGDLGEMLNVNLNYYDTGVASPHVPEICWAGNGMIEKKEARHIFTVPNVRRRDGSVIDLRMRMISFLPPVSGDDSPLAATSDDHRLLNVAYVFHVNGNYVATPEEVVSTFWKAENKHAYHCKIEVSLVTRDERTGKLKGQYCQPEEAERIIGDFIRVAIPEIEECLPDPRRLNEDTVGAATAAAAGS